MAEPGELPRAYLDTCIVSGLAKEDLALAEQAALDRILELGHQGRISLETSAVTAEEISQLPDGVRRRHERIYLLLRDIPASRAQWIASGLAAMGVGGPPRMDPLYAELRKLLPDEADAQHVFQAVQDEVPYFVTTDGRTILKFAPDLKDKYGITALLPSELVERLEAA